MFSTIFTKQHPQVGSKPGTLVIPDEAPEPRIRLISYGPAGVEDKECGADTLNQLSEAFADETVTWIDIQGFGDKQLVREIGKTFRLHPLLLEDVVNVPQRPRVSLTVINC